MRDAFRAALEALAPKDVFASAASELLTRLPRYLEALALRAGRVRIDPEKDRKKAELVEPWRTAVEKMAKRLPVKPSPALAAAAAEFRLWVEEYKVAVFAPELKTAFPVSPQRLAEKVREIEAFLAEEAPAPSLRSGIRKS